MNVGKVIWELDSETIFIWRALQINASFITRASVSLDDSVQSWMIACFCILFEMIFVIREYWNIYWSMLKSDNKSEFKRQQPIELLKAH